MIYLFDQNLVKWIENAERKNVYWKPAYAYIVFYPVRNFHFVTSSQSLVI